jgi:hypothetical protein
VRTRESGADYAQTFDAWGEFVDASAGPEVCALGRYTSGPPEWFGTPSPEKALALARDGWPEGEDHIRPLSMALFDKLATLIERQSIAYDVEGEQVDIGRYLEGEPECWQRTVWTTSEGVSRRSVRITTNGFVSSRVGAKEVIARGATICALAQLLEFAGIGVQIDLTFAGQGRDCSLARIDVPIKSADQPLDLGRAAFALAHPSLFRRIIIRLSDTWPERARKTFGATGESGYYFSQASVPDGERGEIHFECAAYGDPQWTDESKARAWIIEQLKAQGVAVRAESEKA